MDVSDLNIKILFITPYISRDLRGNCLIGYYLKKKYNIHCDYLNGYGIEKKLLQGKYSAIVFDHLEWSFKVDQIKFAKKIGIKTIVLPTEGLIEYEQNVLDNTGITNGSISLVDLQIVWGEKIYEIIKKSGKIDHQKISLTGSSRFDFYHRRFQSLVTPREEFFQKRNMNPEKKMLLWATNTSYVGLDEKNIIQKHSKNGQYTPEMVKRSLENGRLQYEDQRNLFTELAKIHTDWNFVIKIHPAEPVEKYLDLTIEFPGRIFVFYNEPIFEYLYHCDVLFQRNCTTANEAWMLNKPVFQIELRNYIDSGRVAFEKGNDLIRNLTEASEKLIYYSTQSSFPEEMLAIREAFIKEYYYKIDGASFVRIGDCIAQLFTTDQHLPITLKKIFESIDKEQYIRNSKAQASLINRIKDVLGLEREKSLRFWKKSPTSARLTDGEREATQEEINQWYSLYQTAKI